MYGAAAVYILTTICTGATVMKLGLKMAPVRIDKERLSVAAALLLGFFAVVYALRAAPSAVYYTVVPATVCGTTILLYVSRFIKEDERRAIQSFAAKLASALTVR
jgi:hypothetical protein